MYKYLVLVLGVACLCAADQTCGVNEVFKSCGTACPPTCAKPGPQICTKQCVAECQCADGFVRNEMNQCVKLEECAATKCAVNEVFKSCGTACPATCAKPGPRPCVRICVAECQCADGFVRNEQNKCVKLEQCSAETCPANEEYKTCGSACEPSCTKPHPTICTMQCVIGCQCKKGFFRNSVGKCVRLMECDVPEECPPHEVSKPCKRIPEPTCAVPNPLVVSMVCMRGCECEKGYVRDTKGQCIKTEDCPRAVAPMICYKPNQIYTECGSVCQPSCTRPMPTFCSLRCFRGCICMPGFYRDAENNCVSSEECGTEKKCLRDASSVQSGILGAFVPACKDDGSFMEKQCHSSSGYCWCVDAETGKEIEGSRTGPGQDQADCLHL